MRLDDTLVLDGDAKGYRSRVALIVGGGIVSAFQVGKAPMALAAVQQDLGLRIAVASMLISAFAIVGALAGTPIGLAVDRIGARRMMVAGLLLEALGSGLGAFSTGPAMLLVLRAAEGLGFLAVIVAAPSLLLEVAPVRHRDRVMALWATFMPVGMTLVMLASPIFSFLGWRGFWLLNATILLVYAMVFMVAMGASAAGVAPAQKIFEDIRQVVGHRGPWALAALFAAFSAAFFSVFSFLPMLLTERFGIDADAANILSGIAIAASGVGNIACGQLLAQGIRSRSILSMSFAVMAICGIGIFALASMPAEPVYGLCIALSFAGGFIPVVVFHEAPNQTANAGLIGVTMGMAMQGNNVGLLLAPPLAGGLASLLGWPAVALWIASICVAAIFTARGLFAATAGHAE